MSGHAKEEKRHKRVQNLNSRHSLCLSLFAKPFLSFWLVLVTNSIMKTPFEVQFTRHWTNFHFFVYRYTACQSRFSYELEMKMREQNRNNKRTEIERFHWFVERIQTRVAYGWLSERSSENISCPRTFQKSIDTSIFLLQHDWPIEQCFLHFRVFFGGKTKSPCFDLFIYWLINRRALTETIFQGHRKVALSKRNNKYMYMCMCIQSQSLSYRVAYHH